LVARDDDWAELGDWATWAHLHAARRLTSAGPELPHAAACSVPTVEQFARPLAQRKGACPTHFGTYIGQRQGLGATREQAADGCAEPLVHGRARMR